MAWRDTEGWLNLVLLGDGRVEHKKERDQRRWGKSSWEPRTYRISCASQLTIPDTPRTSPDPTRTNTIRGLPNPIRQVVPLISDIRSYPPYHSHQHPPSLSFSSTTQPSSQNTKLSHPSLSLHDMIMSWHRVQHPPKIVCLPFILMITRWPLSVASAPSVPPYTIDRHQPALH